MKATELRIGNYVWENYSGEMIIRSIIYNSPVTTHPKDNGSHTIHLSKTLKLPICGYDISAIKPIPITEEWLIKFGFKKLGKDTFYLGAIKIHKRNRGFVIAKRYVDILYIHQLQNLYFALTGKELTI